MLDVAALVPLLGSCATLLLGLNQDMILKQQQLDNITANLQRNQVPAALGRSTHTPPPSNAPCTPSDSRMASCTSPRMAGVRAYYQYMWSCGHAVNEAELYKELPEKMRLQLLMNKKRLLLTSVEIFRNVSVGCTIAIVKALRPVIVLQREYVCVQGQRGDEMCTHRTQGH